MNNSAKLTAPEVAYLLDLDPDSAHTFGIEATNHLAGVDLLEFKELVDAYGQPVDWLATWAERMNKGPQMKIRAEGVETFVAYDDGVAVAMWVMMDAQVILIHAWSEENLEAAMNTWANSIHTPGVFTNCLTGRSLDVYPGDNGIPQFVDAKGEVVEYSWRR